MKKNKLYHIHTPPHKFNILRFIVLVLQKSKLFMKLALSAMFIFLAGFDAHSKVSASTKSTDVRSLKAKTTENKKKKTKKKLRLEFNESTQKSAPLNKTVIYNPATGKISNLPAEVKDTSPAPLPVGSQSKGHKSNNEVSAVGVADGLAQAKPSSKERKNEKRKEAEDTITDINLRRALKGVDDLSIPWGIRLTLRSSTDLADPSPQKLYTNALNGSYEYTFKNGLTLYGSTGVRYTSVDNSTRAVSGDKPELDDLSIGAAGPIFDRSKIPIPLSGNFTVTLPTSEEARYEGYQGVVSASLNTFQSFWRFSLVPSLFMNYVMNKFEKSPQYATVNSDWSYGGGSRLNLRLGAGFTVFLGAGINFTRYLDNIYTSGFSNSMGLGYASSSGNFIVNMGFTNGSYPDQNTSNLWFVDSYRRNLSLSLSYLFN